MCRRAAEYALEIEKNLKVFAAVVVSQGVIVRDSNIEEIAGAFRDLGLDGFLLWVDDLDENEAGGLELRGLIRLARRLRKDGSKEVINLHGGYFSILAAGSLGASAMTGVSHGPEFGEHRAIVPVGGGIPIARYYIPKLHSRMRYRDALDVFRQNGWLEDASSFHRNVCNCQECVDILAGNPGNFTLFGEGTPRQVRRGRGIVRIDYPTAEAKLHCLRHYLQRKEREYRFAASSSTEELLDDPNLGLRCDVSRYEETAGLDAVSHLALWADILLSGTD